MAKRHPIQRTRQYDIWAEKSTAEPRGDDGQYRLVLQLVDEVGNDFTMIRAAYKKDGQLRPRPPVFVAEDWVEVLSAALADEEFFTDAQVGELRKACAKRLEQAGGDIAAAEPISRTRCRRHELTHAQ